MKIVRGFWGQTLKAEYEEKCDSWHLAHEAKTGAVFTVLDLRLKRFSRKAAECAKDLLCLVGAGKASKYIPAGVLHRRINSVSISFFIIND